jgi:hypothetical protein
VTLVLENKLDLLMVMPTGHVKSTVFMNQWSPTEPSLWWYLSLSWSTDIKLMQVEAAYDMQPMAWTQLRLMIFHPSCSC